MLLAVLLGIFFVLHSLVHLLYFGQCAKLFELQPELVWPDGAWSCSKLLGDDATRVLASFAILLAAIGFGAGGIGLILGQGWWHPVVVASAGFSAMLTLLFWNGKTQRLDDQGGIGLLINLAILAALLLLRWPILPF